jgi:molybdate/tungstate transport system substrate-binding protein
MALACCTAVHAAASTQTVVSVLYAGSLVRPMEGPIRAALGRAAGIDLRGEPGGSWALERLIAAGFARPDVFISADPAAVHALGDRVLWKKTFGGTTMVLAWSPRSPLARTWRAVSDDPTAIVRLLRSPGVRVARTDPRIDPKGRYTIEAVRLLAGAAAERAILGSDENAAQIFPEEDLLARLEAGEADVTFLYRTEAIAAKLPYIELPGPAALRGQITYTLAILRDAPHPVAARQFAQFLVHGEGRAILQRAGVVSFGR